MNNKGFTLVELAIVLVIVGLLVGGVLQGQELIKQAQIRNTVQEITSLDTAVNTFRAKYREYPGDITRASTFGIDTNFNDESNASGDGDGDGNLESDNDATDADRYGQFLGEIANFWVNLSNANLVKGQFANDLNAGTVVQNAGSGFPDAEVGTGIIAITESGIFNWILGVTGTLSDLDAAEEATGSLAGNNLTAEEAFGIDSKVDDGQPDNGIISVIIAVNGTTGATTADTNGTGTTADADNCQSAGEYNLAYAVKSCTLKIRASI